MELTGGWSFELWYRKTTQNTVGVMMAMTACGATGITLQPASTVSYGIPLVNLCDCGYPYQKFDSNPECFYSEYERIVNPGQSNAYTYFYGPIILNTRAFFAAQGNLDLIGSGVPALNNPRSGFVYTEATGHVTNIGLHHYVHTINYPNQEYVDYLDGNVVGHSTANEGITLWDPYTPFDLEPTMNQLQPLASSDQHCFTMVYAGSECTRS